MKTKQDIFEQLSSILEQEFEIEPSEIKIDSHMYTDLDLDSIDAVDLVIKLQELTGKTIDPETFKAVRTIQDVVDVVYKLIQ